MESLIPAHFSVLSLNPDLSPPMKDVLILKDHLPSLNLQAYRIILYPRSASLSLPSYFYSSQQDDFVIGYNLTFYPFTIQRVSLTYGRLGFFGQLGYTTSSFGQWVSELRVESSPQDPPILLSAHAPSSLEITIVKGCWISGGCSSTSESSPVLTFKVDDQVIGSITNPSQHLPWTMIPPGPHRLTVETNHQEWAHSYWQFRERMIRFDLDYTGRGLTNQLIGLINGLIIAILSQRQIYHPRFLPDYQHSDWIYLSEVLDLNPWNQILSEYNLKIETDQCYLNRPWVKSSEYNRIDSVFESQSISKIGEHYKKCGTSYLQLGCTFGITFHKDSGIQTLERRFYQSLQVNDKVQQVVNWIKQQLGDHYQAVHLRFEDDFIHPYAGHFGMSHEEYAKILTERYLQLMEKLLRPGRKIYLATSKNYHHSAIDKIRERYPDMMMIPWRSEFTLPLGREIDALVDFMVCRDATAFVGTGGSTFSILLKQYYIQGPAEIILEQVHRR